MANTGNFWTTNQLAFMHWLATPKSERHPHDQREFAKQIGVKPPTLSRWKNIEGFHEEVNNIARVELKKHTPDVLGALAKFAKAGSFQHLQLFLKVAEEYQESVNVNVDDKRELAREYLDELAERRKARLSG